MSRGTRVAVLGTGGALPECVQAVQQLKEQGLSVTLVNVHTIKPFDVDGIIELARDHKFIVTVEDHYTTGGLGSAVAEVLADHGSTGVRLVRLGVQDLFGESGEPAELYEQFGFSARKIVEKVLKISG